MPNKLWKVARIEEQGVNKKFGNNFVPFESPQIHSNQFEYLVRCSLVQLCVASERGRDTASPCELDWQKWELEAITTDYASLHTSRCQLMNSFNFRKSGNLNTCFLLIKAII